MTPTKHAQLILFTILLLGVLGASTHDVWPIALACGQLAALALCWVVCWSAPVPTAQVGFVGDPTVGEPVTSVIALTNHGRSRSRPTIVVHRLCRPLVEPARWHVEPLAPGERAASTRVRVPTQRGQVNHTHVDVECSGPFGLFVRRQKLVVRSDVLVRPENLRPAALPILAGKTAGGRAVPAGDELRGIREWRPGDSPRHVHWRSTARTGALTVVERGEPESGSLIVVAAGTWGEPAYEGSLATATATARDALARGWSVRLFVKTAGSDPASLVELDQQTVDDVIARLDIADAPDEADLRALGAAVRPGAGVLLAAGPDAGREEWPIRLAATVGASGGRFLQRAPS